MKRKAWDMFFLVMLAGIPAIVVTALSARLDSGGIPKAVTTAAAQGSLFGALVGFAGLLLSVMLAVLTIITSMDERPLIKQLKALDDNKTYERLVYAMLGPIFVAIVLAVLSIACIALPNTGTDDAPSTIATVLVSVTIGIAVTVMVQTGYVAVLIARMLIFRGKRPLLTPRDEPDAVKVARPVEDPPAAKTVSLDEARSGPADMRPASV